MTPALAVGTWLAAILALYWVSLLVRAVARSAPLPALPPPEAEAPAAVVEPPGEEPEQGAPAEEPEAAPSEEPEGAPGAAPRAAHRREPGRGRPG